MEYLSQYSPSEAIKITESFFENEILNTVIKEKPLSKKDPQILEVGVTGGRWEIYWVKIYASRATSGETRIFSKGRPGLAQLSFGVIIWLLAGPFLYYVIANNIYWTLIFPAFFFILGLLSVIMPIIQSRKTQKTIQAILQQKREIKKKEKIPS